MTTDDRNLSGATFEPALLPKQEGALKPCPFCGLSPKCSAAHSDGASAFCFECPDGCSVSKERPSYDEAIIAWNTRSSLPLGEVVQEEAHATKPSPSGASATATETAGKIKWPDDDDRPLPTYGQIPWRQLGRDVVDAQIARRRDYEFDPSFYPGHQTVTLNFNSLARIVDKYRYYGKPPALSETDAVAPENVGGTETSFLVANSRQGEPGANASKGVTAGETATFTSDSYSIISNTVFGSAPTLPGEIIEAIARIISEQCLGHDFNGLYADKREWLDDRGARHDVNVPYKADVLAAADAILAAISALPVESVQAANVSKSSPRIGGTMTDEEEPKIDTSNVACSLVCMLVSNPADNPLPVDWKRRVNDLIRALRDERNDLQKRLNKAIDELSYADLRASGGIAVAETRRTEGAGSTPPEIFSDQQAPSAQAGKN